MKRLPIIAALIAVASFTACEKAEVIPAPTQTADLKVHFDGIVNGNDVEWTKNVNGYYSEQDKKVVYDSSAMQSKAQYYAYMRSNTNLSSIGMGLGSINFDPAVSENVSQDVFFNFFETTNAYPFSNEAMQGMEIIYTDASGRVYYSKEANPGTATFVSFDSKQDEGGDYVQFECQIDCAVYSYEADTMTANIQGAVFKGWFKR
jgi:hypothetical protein